MVDYDLAHWIQEQRNKKFSEEQITSYLLNHGRNQNEVTEAIRFLATQNKQDLAMGPPPTKGGVKIGNATYDLYSILSIIGLFVFPLAAIPLSIISLVHIKHNPQLKGKGLALTALLLPFIIFIIIVGAGFIAGFRSAITP